jgi:hypothetical protein
MPNGQLVKTYWNNDHLREVFLDESGSRVEEMGVFDISILDWRFRHYSYEEIVTLYHWFDKSLETFIRNLSPSTKFIHGIDSVVEFRIANHDATELSSFKRFLVEAAIRELNLEERKTSLNLLQSIPIIEDGIIERFLTTFRQKYDRYGPVDGSSHMFPLYSVQEGIYGTVWDKLQRLGDSYIFVAHGAVPFMVGFYLRTKDERIILTEEHLTLDPYKNFRRHPLDENILLSLSEGEYRHPLIIDKAYTGKTLKALKEKFPDSLALALSPKTRLAIKNSDYFVFNNELFAKSDVDLYYDNWHLRLLEKSLKRGV